MTGPYGKKLGACDTPKINASVEGQNWGSIIIFLWILNIEILSIGTTLKYSSVGTIRILCGPRVYYYLIFI